MARRRSRPRAAHRDRPELRGRPQRSDRSESSFRLVRAKLPVSRDRSREPVLVAVAIFAVALVVRALHVWQIRRAPFFGLKLGDAAAYDAWARQIVAGDWVGHEVFYQAPLYPYVLAVVYRT